MKELVAFSVMLATGIGFLWGFSTSDQSYRLAAPRQAYYEAQVAASTTPAEKDAWLALIQSNPVRTNCSPSAPPRPTRVSWLGDDPAELAAWSKTNEALCLEVFARQMRMINHTDGQEVASKALSSL